MWRIGAYFALDCDGPHMAEDDGTTRSGPRPQYVVMLVVGMLAALFVLIPATRPLALVALWIGGPVVAFGSLFMVFRGERELHSGRGIIFAMCCASVSTVAIPLGFLVAAPTLGESLSFLGFVAAAVAILVATLSVTSDVQGRSRDVPPAEAFEKLEVADDDGSDAADVESRP